MRLMLAPAGGDADLRLPDFQPMPSNEIGAERRTRLGAARLYLVFAAAQQRHQDPDLLRAAAAGGVDVVQLRDKHLGDEELVAVAHATRALCERLGLLLIVNDRP